MTTELPVASLARRLGAMLYDLLLLAALLCLAALPVVIALGAPAPPAAFAARLAFQLYLLLVAFLFYGWFWVHGGQTLGMRTWRLRLVAADGGGRVGWPAALKRFFGAIVSAACLGLGFLWVLRDREGLAWHDRWSHTRIVVVPRAR